MYLTCHITPHDDLIEGSCEFMGGSSLRYVTFLIGLVTISIVIVEMFLICYVTSRKHILNGLGEFLV